MPNRNTRYVVPAGPKKWAGTEPKEGATSTRRTQEAAQRAAKGSAAIWWERGDRPRA